ncbi:PLDc N-terminal domain-containing protein [Clostridium folliculivorans]|uniref:Negative regulatory protein YxlE n=1 Tax=Clostridium folliculivorans TaxID=2886038 RepID=A0A9W5Y0B6_9CLOT|nr:PLDc N-terminal domain-containing protein [Clostridium folliculivorans]GKU24247.1 negative regulatory protein YxlE [Clostridium folliculivorans]GKU30352.1 negative regulatory protein YxlE [Clostridium folliculivorans]
MNIDLTILMPVLLLQVIFSIFCFVKLIKNPAKHLPKWLWAILCLNTLGCILYLALGKDEE